MKPTAGQVAWLAYAAVMVVVALAGADPTRNDFSAFYLSGAGGVHAVDRPDLNPPFFAWLMAPFTLLPMGVAFFVWTALGIVAVVASLRLIATKQTISLWAYGAIGATMPALIVWQEGQITWFLLYFVTRAWASSSSVRAGLWLVPVVMVKPPLALMVLLLPWRVWSVAGAAAGVGTVLTVAVTGVEPWLAWMEKSQFITWADGALSASLWSLAARLLSITRFHELPTSAIELVLFALVILGAKGMYQTRGDGRWIAGILFATLASPLGWIYYLPVALGPLVRSWRQGYVVPLALLSIPSPLFAAMPSGSVIAGTIYAAAVLVAWRVSVNRSVNRVDSVSVGLGQSPFALSRLKSR